MTKGAAATPLADDARAADGVAPDLLDAALAFAVRTPKSDGPEGSEPLLGPQQVARVRATFANASAQTRVELLRMLSTLDGPASAVSRALLLRAVAARSHALVEEKASDALVVLARFCDAMHGLSAHALRARATVLDLDSRTNTHHADPQQLWETRGSIKDTRTSDTQANNDGLFQRFTGACGPTTVQMMLAENDPVFAFAIHDACLHSFSTDDATATFQRTLLEHYGGGKSLGRVEAWLRARVHNALGRLGKSGDVNAREAEALRAHLFLDAPLTDPARAALTALRARYGFPDDDAIARMRARAWPKADEGITTDALVKLLNDQFAASLGASYQAREFARGHAWRHLDDVVRALKAGVDVPFGCSDPGHWMLLSAVRGRKPHRELLVSDPDGGRTLWVSERRFLRGAFLREDLHLPKPGQDPWVDSFLLPRERP
jgi:hypothetical protein